MDTFLVKVGPPEGLAAHLVDAFGKPMCKSPLKLSSWKLQSQLPEHMPICKFCLKKQSLTGP
jgi:hypothetical protein